MARWWKESLDPNHHRDFMSTCHIGGLPIEEPADRLIKKSVYFVEVAGFTFQFASLDQLRTAISFFEKRIHPSSLQPDVELEHYWQRWYERLPQILLKESRRIQVVSALSKALLTFESDRR